MVFRKKKGIGEYISDGLDVVSAKVGNFASHKFDDLINKIEYKVMNLQDRVLKKLTSGLLLVVSIVFLSLGCFYLLKEFFILSNTVSFFTIGILLFVISLYIKSNDGMYRRGYEKN
ncbi:MAG: hypothetical protein AABX10_02550 [Nanoarchaeota archaeon]